MTTSIRNPRGLGCEYIAQSGSGIIIEYALFEPVTGDMFVASGREPGENTTPPPPYSLSPQGRHIIMETLSQDIDGQRICPSYESENRKQEYLRHLAFALFNLLLPPPQAEKI